MENLKFKDESIKVTVINQGKSEIEFDTIMIHSSGKELNCTFKGNLRDFKITVNQ